MTHTKNSAEKKTQKLVWSLVLA